MAFSSGFLNERIIIATRAEEAPEFGKQGQTKYQIVGPVWANASYLKGQKRLEEAAMDATNTMLFRCRFHGWIDEWCKIKYQGKWYDIQSCNGNEQKNEMQITATRMANQSITIIE